MPARINIMKMMKADHSLRSGEINVVNAKKETLRLGPGGRSQIEKNKKRVVEPVVATTGQTASLIASYFGGNGSTTGAR